MLAKCWNRIGLAACMMLLAACAALNPLLAAKGRHISTVVAEYGQPHGVQNGPAGRIYYWKLPSRPPEYSRRYTHTAPNRSGGMTRYYENVCRQRWADRYYHTDADGVVVDIQIKGWYQPC
ncbi:MAG: hypothetical protein Q4A62_10385 [Eikenella sp.]|nr:hypothetical protein [Eikenella sp.]